MRTKLVLLSLLLSSCGYFHTPALTPYKMDIRQGNYVTPEMREKLKLGMTRSQVRYVLGTPMVSDPFHANRWDYVYRLEHEGEIVEKQNLTVYFDGDNLVRVDDGGKTVADMPVVAQAVDETKPVAQAPLEAAEVVAPEAGVQLAVKLWAEAWSARDVGQYLSSYAASFKPAGMSRAKWEAQRKERIGKAHSIVVEVSELKVELRDDSHATATFRQDYRSDSYKDSTRKTLVLEKSGDTWLIVAEQVAK